MPRNTETSVAVIATTYTASRLEATLGLLDGLRSQVEPPDRLVFVVQRDSALAKPIAEAASRLLCATDVLFCPDIDGLAAARNVALERATEKIVAFVDDDAVPTPSWVAEIRRAFDQEDVVGVTGPADPIWDGLRLEWVPPTAYWLFSCTGGDGWDRAFEVRNAWGSNMAFRREAVIAVGGFDPDTGLLDGGRHVDISEDVDLSLRVRALSGQRIVFVPGMRVCHRAEAWRLSPRFVLDRAAWVAAIDRDVRHRWPGLSESTAHQKVARAMLFETGSDLATWLLHPLRNGRRLGLRALIATGLVCGWLLPGTVLRTRGRAR